jgi:F-type H+-transporting ATPase subunit gamma
MANLKDIRNRIQSVKNTQKITKAMKMVAAARLRRNQERLERMRPYAEALEKLTGRLAAGVGQIDHPLLKRPEPRKVLLLVLTGDRGLCGAFNTNAIKAAEEYLRTRTAAGETVHLGLIGKKAHDYFKRREVEAVLVERELMSALDFPAALPLANQLMAWFTDGTYDRVDAVHYHFRGPGISRIEQTTLLPVVMPEADEHASATEYLFEPSAEAVLTSLLPKTFRGHLFHLMMENVASEHGARMVAMENATKNAGEMIDKLTLKYNKARQAAITTELMDIIGGAEALAA